jgi:hypothetical protein
VIIIKMIIILPIMIIIFTIPSLLGADGYLVEATNGLFEVGGFVGALSARLDTREI